MRALPALMLLLAACSFDRGGVQVGDDVGDDVAIDASTDEPPDAGPPDQDHDGVVDGQDNCVAVANPDQANEDGDVPGDVCDNCPHVINPSQSSGDGDPVGDDCDPHKDTPGDSIVLFDGFNGTARDTHWLVGGGTDSWTVSGGYLHQPSELREDKILTYQGISLASMTIDTAVTPTSIPASIGDEDNLRTAAVVSAGRTASIEDKIISTESPAYAVTSTLDGTAINTNWAYAAGALVTTRYLIHTTLENGAQTVTVTDGGGGITTASEAAFPPAGAVGVRTRNIAADFQYVVVFDFNP